MTETRIQMDRIIGDALGMERDDAVGTDPVEQERLVTSVDLLSAVWMSVLVEWISGVTPARRSWTSSTRRCVLLG